MNLENAIFNRVPPAQANGELNVLLEDRVDNIKVGLGEVEFNYIRNVKLNPYSLFDITLTFLYKATFDESFSKEKVEEALKKNIEEVVNKTTMPAVASQIIANLTSVNGGAPLVVVPVFVKNGVYK